MRIYRKYSFDAAHQLPNVPYGHKCGRMHGHTYHVKITVKGPVNEQSGWVMDFAAIDEAWKELVKYLDHQTLNNVPGLANPTSENLAVWIAEKLSPSLPGLQEVEVSETPNSGAVCTVGDGWSRR